jgi:hypothetical protein
METQGCCLVNPTQGLEYTKAAGNFIANAFVAAMAPFDMMSHMGAGANSHNPEAKAYHQQEVLA